MDQSAVDKKPRRPLDTKRLGLSPAGVELRLIRDGEFKYGRCYDTRMIALEEAAAYRSLLERDGWRPIPRQYCARLAH